MKNSASTKNYRKRIYFTSDNSNKKYKITREYLPNLNEKNQVTINLNIEREKSIKKEINILEPIWDELEISWQYREAFSIYIRNMNDEYKNNIITQEKNNLKKFKKALINLKKEIELRDNNILLLKNYNNRLENFNNKEQTTNIIEEITRLVKKLRKNAINIVKEYSQIENISKNYSNISKITRKILKTDYTYDPNYINKMQDDLLFLKESTISNYFEMDNKYIDPFLTNFCTTTKDVNKHCIENPKDILTIINEARYILFRNQINEKINVNANNINNMNTTLNTNKDNKIETIYFKGLSRNFSSKVNRKAELKKNNDIKPDKKIDKFLNQLKLYSPSKYSQLFLHKKSNFCELTNFRRQMHIEHKEIKPNKNYTNVFNLNTQPKKKEETKLMNINRHIKEISHDINNININYYTGDINDLLKTLEDKIPLNKIPKIYKNVFNLDEKIYKKEFYLKGVFPKIIILTINNLKNNENEIIGLCPYYFEWKEEPKNLTLKIIYIMTNDNNNYEKYISKIIDYIKINAKFDRMEITFINDDFGKKVVNFFKGKLKFKFSKVVKNQKDIYQLITLYLEKTDIKDFEDIFVLKNKSILTLDNNRTTISDNIKFVEDKYINNNNIYYMLLENKNIKVDFPNESKFNEIKYIKRKISDFSSIENNYKIKEDNDIKKCFNESKIKDINDEGSLYKINLGLNFEECYTVILDDIYYNKISSKQMKVYQDEKTNSIFYFIPAYDSPFAFNICEINSELKSLLLNDNDDKNIHEKFLDFNMNSKPTILEKTKNNLYIPAFILIKHFLSKNLDEINNNIKISDETTKSPLYLSSVNEFINVEFKPDLNIKNNFLDKNNNINDDGYIIKNEFIISIFRNEINNENKLSLIQMIFVEKDNFLTKSNYKGL